MAKTIEIQAKSLLRKYKRIDSWFITRYGMNLYRGCVHNCLYCDGRAEKYQVEGEFGEEVRVKTNAPEILKAELNPATRRKVMKRSFMMMGGGVGDSYQHADETYQLSRKTLQIIGDYGWPVHLLTKSRGVLRDLDILKKINKDRPVIVSMSFSSVNEAVSRHFEPGVPPPAARLDALAACKDAGLTCGMFLMPVIPYVSDTAEMMEASVQAAAETGLDFIIFSGMTLKEGRQKAVFNQCAESWEAGLSAKIAGLYTGDQWGSAAPDYYQGLQRRFYSIISKSKIPLRIPPAVYLPALDANDRVIVGMDHIDAYLKCKGEKSWYGYAAHQLSKLTETIEPHGSKLQMVRGVSRHMIPVIEQLLATGDAPLYKRLRHYQ